MSTESVGSWSPSLRPRRLFWEGDSRSQDAPEEQKPLYFVGEHERHRSLDSPLKAKTSPGPSDPAADGRDYPVKQCPCGGGQCVVLVSRTERNPGRHFYRCPVKSVNEGCKYFQWCDMASPNQQHGMNSPVKPNKENGVHSPANQRFDVRTPMKLNQQHGPLKAAHPICSCGAGRCSVLTTQHGENAGRKYYACTIKKGQGACNHFQWVDSLGEQSEIRNNNLAEHKLSSPTLIPEELDIPNIDEVVNNYFDKKTSPQKQKTVKIDNHKLSSPTLIPEELDIPNIDEVVDNYFDKKTSSQKQETVKIDNHKEAKAVKVAMGYQFSSDLSTFPKSPLVSPKRQYQPNIVVATSPIKRLNLNYVSPGTSSPGKCYRCGKEGHWMSKCTGSPSSPCFKCGKVGHWKKDCTG